LPVAQLAVAEQHEYIETDSLLRPDSLYHSPEDWLEWVETYAGDTLALHPIDDPDTLAAAHGKLAEAAALEGVQAANHEVRVALVKTVLDFHFTARSTDGDLLSAPGSYQINEPGFNPLLRGKASPEELQAELDRVIESAARQGIDLGLETDESLAKILIQLGVGQDCSNIMYRLYTEVHRRLDLADYTSFVFWPSDKVLAMYESGRWPAGSGDNPRKLTSAERQYLLDNEHVSVKWICQTFGTGPQNITSAAAICADEATVPVGVEDILPGDLVRFRKTSGQIAHVAAIEEVSPGGIVIWHSWHTRRFDAGLRRDTLYMSDQGEIIHASHPNLVEKGRYAEVSVRRPKALAQYYDSLRTPIAV
jgi:hypothetical protein